LFLRCYCCTDDRRSLVAQHCQLDLISNSEESNFVAQIGGVVYRPIADSGNQISNPKARALGRRPSFNFSDHRARVRSGHAQLLGGIWRQIMACNPKRSAAHISVSRNLIRHATSHIDGDRESDTDIGAVRTGNCGVYADELSSQIDQRTA
jgi:hypothetical protein